MLQIKSYPAHNGDAFLIKADSPRPTAVLVDGGYSATFHRHIRADLEELARHGYSLDLVVATHIDSDHVSGLLPLFKANGESRAPKIIGVGRVFHNSLRSIASGASATTPAKAPDEELLEEIRRGGFPPAKAEERVEGEISARQGSSLAALLKSGGYMWNEGDGRTSVCGDGLNSFSVGAGMLTVIGPPRPRLEKLLTWWTSEIRRLGYAGPLGVNDPLDDAFEFLCAVPDPTTNAYPISGQDLSNLDLKDCYLSDDSVTNGSSITFILKIGAQRVLFLGDGWAEDAEAALRMMNPSPDKMLFDAIKVSHHGSLRNTSPSLLGLIDAPRYFISSNGDGHDHPDLPVLKAIVDRAGEPRELLFNYPTAASGRLKTHRSQSNVAFSVREAFTDWVSLGIQARP